MKKLRGKLWIKICVTVILLISVCTSVIGGVASILMLDSGYYTSDVYQGSTGCARLTEGYLGWTANLIQRYDGNDYSEIVEQTNQVFTNLKYKTFIINEDKEVLLLANNNWPMDRFIAYNEYSYTDINNKEIHMRIYYTIRDIQYGDEYWDEYQLYLRFSPYKWTIAIITAVSVVLSFSSFIFLLYSAGHHDETDSVQLSPWDKIPLEIYSGVILAGIFFCFVVVDEFSYISGQWIFIPVLLSIGLIVFCLILALILSCATRIKTGTLLTNTLSYAVISVLLDFLNNLGILWQIVLIFCVYIFFISVSGGQAVGFITMLFIVFLFIFMCVCAIQTNQLVKATRHIAKGELNYRIDTKRMFWKFKSMANDINHIQMGLNRAVDNQMRSERIKTELITNVSHDIKTPLTSIINYVDLLKKEEINNPNAKEYIEILERQSVRLKKLTEDVLEASKASTGNIQVNLEKINVIEIINQSLGEYEDTFEQKSLTPVLNVPDYPLYVEADGRLLW